MLVDDIQEFKDEEANLLRAIDPNGDQYKQLNFLTGYSGNGKTTFINWFRRRLLENQRDQYSFHYLNLISASYSYFDIEERKKNILINAIFDDFKKVINDSRVFIFIRNNKAEMRNAYFQNDEEWNAVWQLTIRNDNIDNLINIFRKLSYSQILLIWLLHYILKEERNNKQLIFCFDNLDELDLQYISKELWKDFHRSKKPT